MLAVSGNNEDMVINKPLITHRLWERDSKYNFYISFTLNVLFLWLTSQMEIDGNIFCTLNEPLNLQTQILQKNKFIVNNPEVSILLSCLYQILDLHFAKETQIRHTYLIIKQLLFNYS